MEALPRSALQALAQKAGVAANQKTAAILAALRAVQACGELNLEVDLSRGDANDDDAAEASSSDSDDDFAPLAERLAGKARANKGKGRGKPPVQVAAGPIPSPSLAMDKKRGVAAAAASGGAKKKKAKATQKAKTFARTEFVLGQYLGAAEQRALAALIAAHGGKVVAAPRWQTDFLVQSHAAEQCDERIELCCELGVLGVPPSFVRACAAAGQLFPFREWAMVLHPDRMAQAGAGCFGGVSRPKRHPGATFVSDLDTQRL